MKRPLVRRIGGCERRLSRPSISLSSLKTRKGAAGVTNRERGDTSVTGWQLTALAVGKAAKLQIPSITLAKADGFLNTVQMSGGASYGYEPGNSGGAANTPIGLLCRIHLGYKKDHPALQRGIAQVSDSGPSPDNMYFNYYATQLMRYARSDGWLKWRSKMRDQLVVGSRTRRTPRAVGIFVTVAWAPEKEDGSISLQWPS